MSFKAEINGNTLIAEISGELDDHVAKGIREKLDFTLMKKEIINIVFDLSGLTFMDSSGIGLLIGRYKQVRQRRGKTIVIVGESHSRKVLKMSGIMNIFGEADSIAEAIDMLA
ncbi:MAG: anti-sigma factor antagonist [Eubacteriaceae bacterium]|nr:anti-sigma factor antagonist [Eubacteriaceae bacterium]